MNNPTEAHSSVGDRLAGLARLLILVVLLAGPIAFAARDGRASLIWLGTGALMWALAVGVKLLTERPFKRWAANLPAWGHAFLWGSWSAVTELGFAALAMGAFLGAGSLAQIISFGSGAGGIEILALLTMSLRSGPNATNEGAAVELPVHVVWSFVVERTGAFIGHVGSRGLIALALYDQMWAAPVAVASFALVDGLAIFGRLRGWDWMSLYVWMRFYALVVGLGLFELLLFLCLTADKQ